jgi:hypothetical protein
VVVVITGQAVEGKRIEGKEKAKRRQRDRRRRGTDLVFEFARLNLKCGMEY